MYMYTQGFIYIYIYMDMRSDLYFVARNADPFISLCTAAVVVSQTPGMIATLSGPWLHSPLFTSASTSGDVGHLLIAHLERMNRRHSRSSLSPIDHYRAIVSMSSPGPCINWVLWQWLFWTLLYVMIGRQNIQKQDSLVAGIDQTRALSAYIVLWTLHTHIYIYIYTHTCTYMCVYTHIYIYIYIYIYTALSIAEHSCKRVACTPALPATRACSLIIGEGGMVGWDVCEGGEGWRGAERERERER